jgi:hypothetical protein
MSCACQFARFSARELEFVGFLGVCETGERDGGTVAVHFDFDWGIGLGAGLAKDGVGGEGLVVNLSNQIGFAGIRLLPDLADLEFTRGHNTNVVRIGGGVNTAEQP